MKVYKGLAKAFRWLKTAKQDVTIRGTKLYDSKTNEEIAEILIVRCNKCKRILKEEEIDNHGTFCANCVEDNKKLN